VATSTAFEEHKRQYKAKLPPIDRILVAPGNTFSEGQLAQMSVSELQKMASIAGSVPVVAA
jgi:hypothetical protein